ncbi:UDP-2-acetamido-2-deoxy-3-oxo-D-glucuronate aminotransferase [bacterium BMS3Abin07]|nr:UDP-2-acetamido-2-deoxy-3-oxo-D-glucuronate aminotransferase [bacterium BMS3Abin07]GBE33080.1 UDP-2-acetamido-2-deoxy-3-oxo-D-glucuronate aminotransferase [bacterium BMS3Bbin05]HDO21761.1 DegT/DnrJ/EryC1/StrS family aminotransferase [Nitrospirota bacterium]HDZ88582.1 DegT/DnrJ/EryC1/StrS family aminotransferase [Nitrospirota bacterium]
MIPMVDLKEQFEEIRDEVMEITESVCNSAKFILGPSVTELEKKIAGYIDSGYALGVASGTDALYLSLLAAGIGEGDEVITTPFTFFATVEAILHCRATPVFVDIDPNTFNIDVSRMEDALTKKTRAILPVHLYGYPCNMDELTALADMRSIAVIEDAAQAFGAAINGRKAGGFGAAGCFSFYPSKNLGCYGDGGMIVTSDADFASTVRLLRNHGSSAGYVHERIGINSRLDELQAAILLVKMKNIERYNERRRKNAALYNKLIGSYVQCPGEQNGFRHVFHQYTVRCPKRNNLQEKLKDAGISSVVYYSVPMHLQKAVGFLGYKKGDFPEAEKAADEVLSLPMYPELGERDIERICSVIKESASK